MALIGISLLVASVVWVVFRPPGWVPVWFVRWTGALRRGVISNRPDATISTDRSSDRGSAAAEGSGEKLVPKITTAAADDTETIAAAAAAAAAVAHPLPPPTPTILVPTIDESTEDKTDAQTTPKASAANPVQPIPSFSLQDDEPLSPPPSTSGRSTMLPPPRPPTLAAPSRAPVFPAINSAQRARGPLPNRNPLSSSLGSGLAPPPTHSSKPSKPSRKVILTPGHSPLDWARISGPTADLRGVQSSSPYLRVTPSMLKKQNGRKGTDAWMGLNGRVYNVSPYAEYHPGGVPELMRGAGKDATKLFGEVHPWVNYETMLSACLIGLMVEEPEGSNESEMDKMD